MNNILKTKKKALKRFVSKVKKLFSSYKNSLIYFSTKEQTFLIKRLSFLIKAGIPVLESLNIIREQAGGKKYTRILDTIIEDVSNGQRLSYGLAKYHNIFGDFSINIIDFGETTGLLSENLEYLADELKKREALRRKVIGAFVYPILVTLATFAITVFLMVYLFPKIIPVFSSLHMTLPLSTRAVIFLSNFVRHYGLHLIAGFFLFVIFFIISLKKSQLFRFYFDKYILKIPIIGEVIKHYNLANSTRTMGLLLKSGITVSDALPITVKTSSNLAYKSEFYNISKKVNNGESMSVYLAKRGNFFPSVIYQIVAVGERSGNLSSSLIYLSELYEAEVDDFTKNISSIIEPVLMIGMGILVGFIAISIITPIYSITQNLHA